MRFVPYFAVAAFVTSITSLAWADMPGGTHCDAPSECTVCSQSEFGSGGGGGASQFDTCVAQVVDELPQLFRRFDVPSEKDKSAGLKFAEPAGGFGIEFGTGDTGEQ